MREPCQPHRNRQKPEFSLERSLLFSPTLRFGDTARTVDWSDLDQSTGRRSPSPEILSNFGLLYTEADVFGAIHASLINSYSFTENPWQPTHESSGTDSF